MAHSSILEKSSATPSLDALYGIVGNELKTVEALMLARTKTGVYLIDSIAAHILASGGKRIRPALTLIAAKIFGGAIERAIPLAAAIEFIHTATLLHDDVVDDSKLRRGLATANEVFGNKASVLVGDFLLSEAFQLTVEDGNPRMLQILSEASAIIAKGEVLQLMNDRNTQTTQEDYLRVISSKTAMLFAAACELGTVTAGDNAAAAVLKEFGLNIGIAFQLIDDVLDYGADQNALGKTVGDDFREGKITLPVIFAYQKGTREEQVFWERTMGELVQQPGDFQQATALLANHHACTQAVSLAGKYCDKARAAIAHLPAGAAKHAMLDTVDFALSRAY
jgi:octaprenyl-diphosphate synthase